MLKGALAGASALTFSQLWGYERVAGQAAGDDPHTILNLAATSEAFACTHYYSVLTEGNVQLSPAEVEIIKGFLDAELQHLEYLRENGGLPLATEFYIPTNIYNDRAQFSEVTELIETTFVGAYLAGARRLAELDVLLLSATAAQVACIEQEHLALIRQVGGKRPNNLAFARPLFFNISEAVPALQPFLEGGENYAGPIAYPGGDAIRELIGDVGVLAVPIFANQTPAPDATQSAGSGVCTVTPRGNFNCNLRSGPALSFTVVDRLAPGSRVEIDGQVIDNDGFPWYRLTSGDRWVRSDIVTPVGECGLIPMINA
jgi:hypothetical protein